MIVGVLWMALGLPSFGDWEWYNNDAVCEPGVIVWDLTNCWDSGYVNLPPVHWTPGNKVCFPGESLIAEVDPDPWPGELDYYGTNECVLPESQAVEVWPQILRTTYSVIGPGSYRNSNEGTAVAHTDRFGANLTVEASPGERHVWWMRTYNSKQVANYVIIKSKAE